MSIPTTLLENTFDLHNPILENWAVIIGVIISFFYLRLGFRYFTEMLFVMLLCILGNFWIGNNLNLFYVSIIIFVLAWIGQFYGHKIEGAKPSFLKDLEFLLIGPLWVIEKLRK